MQSRLFKKNCSCVRQGLSIVEFIGCIVALCGGVVLGAMYLGIDLKAVAADTLEKTRDTEHNLPDTSSVELAGQSFPSKKTQPTGKEKAKKEPLDSQADVDTDQLAGEASGANASDLSEAQRAIVTQVYWKALVSYMDKELAGRKPRGKDIESWQMFEHLENRQIGHQNAADNIKQLDERGVDQSLLDHASQVISWNLAGAQLYKRALGLITDGPSANLLGPFAQSWQSAATQHRMEEKLVQEKHVSVAGYLNHTYKEYGPFKPAAYP